MFMSKGNDTKEKWRAVFFAGIGVAAAVLIAIAAMRAQSRPAQPVMLSAGKKAEEAYKNIQVLKGAPADQLMPAMQFISASLGVQCDYCHEMGSFDKDDKKPKQIARKMMEMMFAINKNNFEGHREVTCYSCHRGAVKPLSTPVIADQEVKLAFPEEPKEEESSNPAAVDQLLDKYVGALGGANAIQKISTRGGKGTIALGANKFSFEVFEKAPNKRMSVMHLPNGDSITAFDGNSGWLAVPRQPLRDMSGAELDAARLDADFYFPLRVKQLFNELRAGKSEKIGDREVTSVVGTNEGQVPVKLYFDPESGLLVRLLRYAESPLGRVPTQIDYADYRQVGVVRTPFRWTISRPGGRFTIQLEMVQQNVPIDDAKFAKPVVTVTQPQKPPGS
jgi:photosynthetic reaction center cytochrome c subunit